jgi:hypothetical protein
MENTRGMARMCLGNDILTRNRLRFLFIQSKRPGPLNPIPIWKDHIWRSWFCVLAIIPYKSQLKDAWAEERERKTPYFCIYLANRIAYLVSLFFLPWSFRLDFNDDKETRKNNKQIDKKTAYSRACFVRRLVRGMGRESISRWFSICNARP